MSYKQTLDPMTWPIGYLMDSGAVVEVYGSATYPLEIWTNTEVMTHATVGIEVNGNFVVMLSGVEAYKLCVKLDVPRWANVNDVSISGGRYESMVFLESQYLLTVSEADPSWRYTGVARMLTQAKHGTGKPQLLIDYPDSQGIIYSTDGRFYRVSMDSGYMIRIKKLRVNVDDCVLENMSLSNDKMLAYLLARVEDDPDTVTDSSYSSVLEAMAVAGYGPFSYNWHFSYGTVNECSKVVAKFKGADWSDIGNRHYLTTILTVQFTIPSVVAEKMGAKVAWSVTKMEEDGEFMTDPRDLYWTAQDTDGYSVEAIYTPCGFGRDIKGDAVAIYCYYGKSSLQVVRYTAPYPDPVDELAPPAMGCAYHTEPHYPGNYIYQDACGTVPPVISSAGHTASISKFTTDGMSTSSPEKSQHYGSEASWTWGSKTTKGTWTSWGGWPTGDYSMSAPDACDGEKPTFGGGFIGKITIYYINLYIVIDVYQETTTVNKAAMISAGNPDAVIFLERVTRYRAGRRTNQHRMTDDWVKKLEHLGGPTNGNRFGDYHYCDTAGLVSSVEDDLDEEVITYTARIKGVGDEIYTPEESDTWDAYHYWSCISEAKGNFFEAMESYGESMVHVQHALPAPVTFSVNGGFTFAYTGGDVFKYVGWV